MSWLRGACTSCERAPASERGAWTSWLRGACTSCDRAPARERGACTSWLLAVCVSIAFADATSGGQEVCAIPTVAEREKTVTTLIVAASNFLIVFPSFLTAFSLRFPLGFFSWPLGPQLAVIGCTRDARG